MQYQLHMLRWMMTLLVRLNSKIAWIGRMQMKTFTMDYSGGRCLSLILIIKALVILKIMRMLCHSKHSLMTILVFGRDGTLVSQIQMDNLYFSKLQEILSVLSMTQSNKFVLQKFKPDFIPTQKNTLRFLVTQLGNFLTMENYTKTSLLMQILVTFSNQTTN